MQKQPREVARLVVGGSGGRLQRWGRVGELGVLGQRFPASSALAREGAGCGSVGDVTGAWLASAPLWPNSLLGI